MAKGLEVLGIKALRCLRTVLLLAGIACAALPPFGADFGASRIDGQLIRPPYVGQLSYIGVMPSPKQVLYAYVPEDVSELGVRIFAPVPKSAQIGGPDTFVEPGWTRAKSPAWAPGLRVSRCLTATAPDELGRPCTQWRLLKTIEPGHALLAPGAGGQGIALRVGAEEDHTLGSLSRGLYQIEILAQDALGAQGAAYLLQLGTTQSLRLGALASSLTALKQVLVARAASTPSIPTVGYVPVPKSIRP